jgi:hypothetical protein
MAHSTTRLDVLLSRRAFCAAISAVTVTMLDGATTREDTNSVSQAQVEQQLSQVEQQASTVGMDRCSALYRSLRT